METKSFEQCFNEVAKKYGYRDWEAVHQHTGHYDLTKLELEAAQLYREEGIKKAIELARRTRNLQPIYTSEEIQAMLKQEEK